MPKSKAKAKPVTGGIIEKETKKEAVKSASGRVVTDKQTIRIAKEKEAEKQAKNKPKGPNKTWICLKNIYDETGHHNRGYLFKKDYCDDIQELIDLGVIMSYDQHLSQGEEKKQAHLEDLKKRKEELEKELLNN